MSGWVDSDGFEERAGSGNDLAEVLACKIAHLLGIPHADYYLAVENDVRGIISKNIVPRGERLIHGNELIIPVEIAKSKLRDPKYLKEHKIGKIGFILRALEQWNEERGFVRKDVTAIHQFSEYLMLDCLIANQDRHYENWGILLTDEGSVHLAPTYDHASSFATTERETTMLERLDTRDENRSLKTFARRAKTQIYSKDGARRLRTDEAFIDMVKSYPKETEGVLDKLKAVHQSQFTAIFESIPSSYASNTEKRFYNKLVSINKFRLNSLQSELTK